MIKSFRRIFGIVSQYRIRLVISQVALAISALSAVGFATLVGPMINQGMVEGNVDRALSIGFWMLVLAAISGLTMAVAASQAVFFSQGVGYVIRTRLYGKIQEYTFENFDHLSNGQLMVRLNADVVKANAHDFIMELPEGYDTMMTERGANLSQGQRQMITIARAMVADPKIMILDEATSNVDTRTEKLIQDGMRTLMNDKTSFSIAHRLATIRDSDDIMVLNGGAIVEYAPHDELMAAKGFYHALYMSQFKGKAPDDSQGRDVDFVST